MTKEFAKKSIAAALTAGVLAFAAATPVRAADESQSWRERELSLTDGAEAVRPAATPSRTPDGARSRIGEPAASPERRADSIQQEWLLQELQRSDEPAE